MLRSKATAALMKLKEIDRKYKMKCSANEAEDSSLSDISGIDQMCKHLASGSGDKPDPITNRRLKLDIRMPEAHMERYNQAGAQETESPMQLVTIFNKPEKRSPRTESELSRKIKTTVETNVASEGVEENVSKTSQTASPEDPALSIAEEEAEKTGTSISEDVPEAVSSSHPIGSLEITLKSVASLIDNEEGAKSDSDDDSSTSVASETYSDDFVKSLSDPECAKGSKTSPGKAGSISSEANCVDDTQERSIKLDVSSESKDKEIVGPVSPKVVNDCDVSSDSPLAISNHAETGAKDVVNLLQTSSQPSSPRSSEERGKRRRPRTGIPPTGDSPCLSSSKRDPETTRSSGSLNPSKSQHQSGRTCTEWGHREASKASRPQNCENEREPNLRTVSFHEAENLGEDLNRKVLRNTNCKNESAKSKSAKNRIRATDSSPEEPPKCRATPRSQKRRLNKPKIEETGRTKNRTKGGSPPQCKTRTRDEPALREADRLKQHMRELRSEQERDRLRSRVRGYVQQMTNEQQSFLARCEDGFFYSYHSCLRQSPEERRRQSFFKPLDLPNVAGFKRPDFEEDQTPDLDNELRFHSRIIRERILGIRHWLKQQFVLYRDYSSLVSTINAKYVPVTLKDTKKMIRDMQRFYNNREKHRLVR